MAGSQSFIIDDGPGFAKWKLVFLATIIELNRALFRAFARSNKALFNKIFNFSFSTFLFLFIILSLKGNLTEKNFIQHSNFPLALIKVLTTPIKRVQQLKTGDAR